MKVIGLTGGIGMGKSTVAAAFRREGVLVFDADREVHRLQAPGGLALPAIAAAFPGVVNDGVLDRSALRAIALADRNLLRVLERILHPLVRGAQKRFLASARAHGAPVVVLDIPLLFETGGERRVDYVVVVSAPASVQVARVRARRRMSDDEIARVIALQTPADEQRRRADIVLRTGLSRYHATRAVRRLLASGAWRSRTRGCKRSVKQ